MEIKLKLNGKQIIDSIEPDMLLLDFCRSHHCKSVKRGCETSNCGVCTVWFDGKPVLSCNILAARAAGHEITTLEGLQAEAEEFGMFLAREGGEQCGFCNPGFIMNVLAMERELGHPSDEEMKEYLSGNLCRCSGYASHMRALHKWFAYKEEQKATQEQTEVDKQKAAQKQGHDDKQTTVSNQPHDEKKKAVRS